MSSAMRRATSPEMRPATRLCVRRATRLISDAKNKAA